MPTHREHQFVAYPVAVDTDLPQIRPAPRIRQWQRDTQDSYAARCLPLNIANNNGWELLLPGGFDAVYSGRRGLADISIYPHGDGPCIAASHFGEGVLTFLTGYLFRTPSDIHLNIGGPTNYFRDGIQAMSGIIETDWSPYNATMNFKFTRSGRVRFNKGEPFAQVFPMPATYVNSFDVRFGELASEDPQAQKDFEDWARSRSAFNEDLKKHCPVAVKQKWQKLYYRGLYSDGERKHTDHHTKLSPLEFSANGLPKNPENARNSLQVNHKKPATALVRVDAVDWRLSRTLDEVATRVQEVVLFHQQAGQAVDSFMAEIPYSNVRALEVNCDQDMAGQLQKHCGFDIVLMLETRFMLEAEFWAQFDDYERLLDEKYQGIQFGQFRSKVGFSTSQKLEEALLNTPEILEPLNQYSTVAIVKSHLGKEISEVFRSKTRLILA